MIVQGTGYPPQVLVGVTITPTSHAVAIVGGPTAWAMCAVDALGIVAMLGRDVTIASTDPYSGEPVSPATPTRTPGSTNIRPCPALC